jgi:hypothetical protein
LKPIAKAGIEIRYGVLVSIFTPETNESYSGVLHGLHKFAMAMKNYIQPLDHDQLEYDVEVKFQALVLNEFFSNWGVK